MSSQHPDLRQTSPLRTAPAAALLMVGCLVASACGTKSPYTIGVVLDKDGVRGASLAAEEINTNGGINGHPLVLRDDGAGAGSTKARPALETAERLAADPAILAVVGHTNSSASLAASQVYNARHIVQIAPTSSAPLYSQAGPYSFRLVGSDVHQGVYLANQVLARSPHPRTAVLFVNDDYGRPLRSVLVEHLRTGGLDVVYDSPFAENDGTADHAELVAALARARPDLLVWIGRSYDFVRIRGQLAKSLPGLPVLASDGFSGETLTNDSLHLLDGVSYVRVVDPHQHGDAMQRVRENYYRAHQGEPTDQALLSYDAVLLLGEALRNAGPHREAIRDWIARIGRDLPAVQGLSGPIAFPSGGDRRPQYFVEEIGRARLESARARQ